MLIYNSKGHLIGDLYNSNEMITGSASKIVWNGYMSLSRVNKVAATKFLEVMQVGGRHSGYVSVPNSRRVIKE